MSAMHDKEKNKNWAGARSPCLRWCSNLLLRGPTPDIQ
eukprot:CAMPEP_0118970982 /NCGR_PEP_ID=MMETSP1173-20130426/7751_1 /TAXON_ID=1034831 /ORGANISM="Rhizochromulina marina cf, Strain CCMP1243" /LENGTH=37 /DNA_ID= /DNA_START= /DNA_END= /DNA_ORIENTATION=